MNNITYLDVKNHLQKLQDKGYRFTKTGMLPPVGAPVIIIFDYVNLIDKYVHEKVINQPVALITDRL